MANYYFLAASLPPLELGEKPDLSFEELVARLQINIEAKDLQKTIVFRRWIDINNIRALFLEDAIDPRGNLSEKELDQALLLHDGLPEYVFDFLDKFESVPEKLRFFPGVLAAYFREETPEQSGFLKRYLEFERAWRLVLVGIKAKELGRDLTEELQFEDLKDPFVMDLLAQKDAASYEPPPEFLSLKEKYLACGPDPFLQFKEISKWRFKQIDELAIEPLFSIDWILSYMAQLLLVEQWNELDSEKGEIILEAFVG
ncbi:MAG: DUF2764 family protein [Rhabdochlamydiaceae bacterium]|nr:DUF2764 family protein [Rhabdochlamydiaceae bacterium]